MKFKMHTRNSVYSLRAVESIDRSDGNLDLRAMPAVRGQELEIGRTYDLPLGAVVVMSRNVGSRKYPICRASVLVVEKRPRIVGMFNIPEEYAVFVKAIEQMLPR